MFLDDIAAVLVAASVVPSTSVFKSSNAIIPPRTSTGGDGPYITITETGGLAPTRVQNRDGATTTRPSAQILVRAASWATARQTSYLAYTALDGIFNRVLGSTFYLSVQARQEPTDMQQDGSGRAMVVFNIEAEKEPL